MAVKKTQMYRRNLDGTETNLNPLTESQYVLMENGQTVQEVLSDRDSDKYTPVITNSSSTFKVGQGDNVDLSSSMKEGAYDSCVLKGKTMVNCIQEPSSQDVVLPYEFTDGQYVTINDTKESGALGVELKGQTLVNLQQKGSYWNINGTENNPNSNASYRSDEGFPLSKLKPNTKYLVKFSRDISAKYGSFFFVQGTQTTWAMQSGGWGIVTTKSELTSSTTSIHVYPRENNGVTAESLQDVHPMIIEYQEGMENWDIPYFEGMTNCKMPILHTVGKNLFDGKLQSGYLQDATGTPTGNKGLHGTTYIPCKPNTAYVISGTLNGVVPRFYFYDREKNYLGYEVGESPYRLFTSRSNSSFMRIRLFSNEVLDISQYGQIQIEESTQETSYEPHKSSILSLPEEVVLRSLSNGVKDTLNLTTGEYVQRIGEVTLTGGESFVRESNAQYNRFQYKNSGCITQSQRNPINSNTFVSVTEAAVHRNQMGFAYGGVIYLYSPVGSTQTVEEFKTWLQDNPTTIQYQLAKPVVTKVNLSSILKSWNTTTHFYSEIPENTLYPTLSHSNPSYPVILKPSTKYSIVANSYSNNHTNSAINFNLGGATASTTVGNRVTTITTPSTLSNELLTMSGRGNKLNNVMVIEGDVVGDEPYFEGMCDSKSPILSNCGKNLLDIKNATKRYSSKSSLLNNGDGSVSVVGDGDGNGEGILVFSCCVYLKEGETYFFSFESDGQYSKVNGSDTVEAMLLRNASASDTIIGMTGFANTFVCPRSGDYYLRFDVNKNNVTHKFWNVYLAQVSTDSPYEPYKSNTTTFEQKDGKTIVLRSLPNGVCDTLNVETGEYVQRIGELVANGDDTITYSGISTTANNTVRMVINHPSIQINPNETVVCAYCDRIKYQYNYQDTTDIESFFVAKSNSRIFMRLEKSKLETLDVAGIKKYLSKTPYTFQYELIEPIVSTIDVQGFPYAYTNGHVQLSFGSIEQSLTPTVEYSLSANKTGQINSNTKRVSAHQKQLDDFEAMMLTQMVQSAYDKAILQFDYEMQLMSLGGE